MALSKSQIKKLKEMGENFADEFTDYLTEGIDAELTEITEEIGIKEKDQDQAYGIIWKSMKESL